MNKHKKFIKEAYEGKHGSICKEWKDTILKHYPEFEQEEFKGGWYRSNGIGNNKWLCFYDSDEYFQYGIGADGKWFDKTTHPHKYYASMDKIKAIPEEVRFHLIAEAEKRGFVEGVSCKSLLSGDIVTLTNTGTAYIPETDELHVKNCLVYKKGQWAEIIPTITKEEAEKKLGMKII